MQDKKRFIQVLDEYQNKQDFQYFDLMNVLQITQLHFANNHYQSQYKYYGPAPSPDPQCDYLSSHFDSFFYKSLDPQDEPIPTSMPIPTLKKFQEINVKINCFADLLKILRENEYDENTEYNIDLKSLTQIKVELESLDKMIGMTTFKDAILDQLLYFIQGLHISEKDPDFMHTILCGPPGTGKTEVAKILGAMYSKIGILKSGIFKKVTRSDLIAGYLGQTAIKTSKVINECLGGCLFIDEAYSLASSDGDDIYSKECLDTLCEALSDHKGELMVIIAGYENELNETFFRVNRGLESRFIWKFKIDEYSGPELADIFVKKVLENEWTLTIETDTKIETGTKTKSKPKISLLGAWFEKNKKDFAFFGRDIELLFSYTKIAHGRRIYGKNTEIKKQISMEDLNLGHKTFLLHSKKKNERKEIFGLYV